MKLHEERPLNVEDQQALAIAAQMVSEDAQEIFKAQQPEMMALLQKVQQGQIAQQQQILNSDPTAQVLLRTQMAETQRKQAESQAKMQTEMQKSQQEYQIKVAQLEQKLQELTAKYQT